MSSPLDFILDPPKVTLVNVFKNPYSNSVATARTCYSQNLVTDEQVDKKPDLRDKIAESTFEAGHHTTLQHAHFQFALEGVSRQFVWSLLHAHPFYNSEQQSQRYVEVRDGSFFKFNFDSGRADSIYRRTFDVQMSAYNSLNKILYPHVEDEYFKIFPGRKNKSRWSNVIQKKTQEISRYVLPIATKTNLYHTISLVTLLRYMDMIAQVDCFYESFYVVGEMLKLVLDFDPKLEALVKPSLDLADSNIFKYAQRSWSENPQYDPTSFDTQLGFFTSKLVSYKSNNQSIMADSVREVLGLHSFDKTEEDLIKLVMHPELNKALSRTLNVTTLDKLSRTMYHPSYTFKHKLSHSADSQDQRHRMTPASRPDLTQVYSSEPDYIIPNLISKVPEALDLYKTTMDRIWRNIDDLLSYVDSKYSIYLLPNAFTLRYTESGDLLNLWHKYKMRLCYNAQDEIWLASKQEVEQITKVDPIIGKYLLPPCGIRSLAGTKPFCPEGDRYCGVPVWKKDIKDYERLI